MMHQAEDLLDLTPGLGSWVSKFFKGAAKFEAKTIPIAKKTPLNQHYTKLDAPSPTENALYSSEGELRAAQADLLQAQHEYTVSAAAVAPSAPSARPAPAAALWKNPAVLAGGAAVVVLVAVLLRGRRND